MDLNLIIIGALTILVMFGVGESVLKKLKLSKTIVFICLLLLAIGLYVPNIKIKQISVSISGVLLPAMISLMLCFKIRSFSVFVSFLLMSFTTLILRLGYYETELVPIIVQAVSMALLGITIGLLSKEPYSAITSITFGFFIGNIIFELIKFGNVFNIISINNLSFILIAQIVSCLTIFAKRIFNLKPKKRIQNITVVQ